MTRKYSTVSYPRPVSGWVRNGLTTALQTICVLFTLFLATSQTALAQCDSQNGTITVTASGGAMNGANLVYVLTNPAGTILNYSTTPTFASVPDGSYQVYAVGYRGSTLPFSIGQGISTVTAGNACVQYSSTPVTYNVCSTSATCDSQNGNITVISSGGVMGTAKLTYLLTDATGNILQTSSSPSFTGVATGTYYVYALGYTTASAPFTIGQNISVIPTNDACARLSPPIGYKVCPIPCPTITNVAANNTNPSSCSGANGSIVICGVTAASSYTISYSKNGIAQAGVAQTANASGCLSLTGLTAGTYTGIQVVNAVCTTGSNTLGPITLADPGSPAAPTLALNSGTICAGQSVTLTASGAAGATFTFSGSGLGTASGNSVVATPTSAGSAVYTVTQSVAGCSSAAASQTVVVNAQPTVSSVATANPTACGTPTGSLTLNGLTPSTAYSVSYSYNGGAATTATLTSNASGQVTLSGLGAGNYTNIMVAQAGCMSTPASATLTDPTPAPLTAAQVTGISPASCGSATGRIDITGLPSSTSVVIGYAKNGTPTSATVSTDASGKASLLNLTAGTYTAFTLQTGACTSAPYAGPVQLSDPGLTPLTAANVTGTSPTSCGNNDGRITLSGLPASTTITITYQVSGTAASANVTTNASGQAVIPNLKAGTYSVIAYTIGTCTSAPYNGTVVINDPGVTPLTAANVAGFNPSRCGQTDGRIEITALAASTVITINYKKNGVAQTASVTTDAGGKAILSGLSAGTYTDFAYAQGACTSAPYAGPVTLTDPTPTPLTAANVTAFNPTSCSATDGRIELVGLASNSSTVITYKKNGVVTTTTVTSDASGKATILNIGAGSYSDFSYAQGTCTSTPYAATLAVNGVNCNQNPPLVGGQPLVTKVNQPGSVCLPVSDADGTTSFTAAICGQPANGTASVSTTFTGKQVCVNYTPPTNFTGNAGTVCVVITDPTGLTSVAYVPVTVTPASVTTTTPQPPIVTVVPITTPINTTALVCQPITSPNGATSFTAAICGQPSNGTATIASTSANSVCIKYTPPTGFTGNAGNVCVTVTDPTGLTTTVTIPVTVTPDPTTPGNQHPPVVVPAPIVTVVNQPGNVCLPLSDPDGTTSFTTAICGQPTTGTATIVSTSTNSVCLNYTPPANFTGNAGTVCVIVTDPTGLTSVAYLPVTVYPTSPQHPPLVTGQVLITDLNKPGSVCLSVSDPDGTTSFTTAICGQPTNGTASVPATITGNQLCVAYTPPTGFTGNAGTVCVIVTDPTGLTSVAYVPVIVKPISATSTTPQPPLVTVVPISQPVNTTSITCQPVSSPNGYTSFTATICGQPTTGTATVVSTSANSVCIKYTPPTNFTGNAGNVCLTVTDPAGLTTTVTVPVTVTPDPTTPGNQHPPVVVPAPIITLVNQPGSICLPLSDPDGTTSFTVSICGQPTNGVATVAGTTGNSVCLSYTPPMNFTGNAGNVCVIVTDPTGLSTTALVPVTVYPTNGPVQHPPVVVGQPLVTKVNQPGSVCLPVSDADGTTSFTAAICGQPTNGTASVPTTFTGNQVCVNYTPPTNFTGNAGTVCVVITDPTGLTSVAYVPVVVNPISGTAVDPKPPVVTVVPITLPVNTTTVVCMPVSDPNGTTSFTAAICGQPTNGTATIVSTGPNSVCIKYTPPTNFTGNAGTVCVTVTDPTGLTTTVTVPVTVIPDPTPNPGVPHPPVVIGAPLVTNQNQPGSICLPVTDPDGTTNFTVSLCGQPTSGTTSYPTTVNGNSLCINYTPVNGFSGNAGTLCLVVTDPTGLTSVAYVPITVVPGNQQRPPVVVGLPLVTMVNQPGNVCLPVYDPDGTTSFTAAICGQPTNGTATVPATVNGNQLCVNYTPPTNFTGNAGTVCVIVTDPTGLTSVAYVPITVTPISATTTTPQPPIVTVVPITTPINTTALVCQPVSDPNGTTSFTAAICGQPANGTVVVVSTSNNSICLRYTPPTGFTGNAGNVCVTVTDPTGLTTTVTIPVTVTPDPTTPGTQHPPTIVPSPIVTLINQPGSVCLPIGDPDGPTNLTVSLCGQPNNGTATIVSANANQVCLSYTPPTGFTGNAGNICVIVTDPTGLSTTALVPVTVYPTNGPIQHPPVITGQPIVTTVNQPGSVCLPVSDSDGTTSFTASICGQPTSGTASVPNTFTGNQVCVNYTPPTNFTGNAGTVCVIITDPTGLTSVAYVPVVVTPISATTTTPLPPVVTVVPITLPVNTTTVVCMPVSDPNGTTSFTAAICGQPANGTAVVVSTGPNSVCIKYTPPTNFTGNAGNVCVMVIDPTGLITTVTVPVTVTPDPTLPGNQHPPVVVPAPIVTLVNQPGGICLPLSDPDGTTSFTVGICGQPTNGTATIVGATGNNLCLSYTPPTNFTGNAGNVCVIVTDPTGLTTTVTVPVTVIPTSQPRQYPPVIVGLPLVTTVNQPGSVCLPVVDPDGTTAFTVSICGQPANGVASVPASVSGNQVCVNYTPPTNFTGNAGNICVIVTDPTGLTSVAYVPVVVTPLSVTTTVTLPPVVTIVPITTPINQTVVVCQPVSSLNGATSFTAAICGQPTSGTVSVVSTGANSVCLKYTPPTGFTGNAGNVCVIVTEPTGQTTVVTVPVTVTPLPIIDPVVPHPPVVVPGPIVTKQGQPGSICLPVTDPDGTTAFTVTVCGQPNSGTATVPATVNNGLLCVSYTPTSSFTGNAGNICVIVTDPTGLSTTALVPVTVYPNSGQPQRPPVITGQPIVTTVNQPGSVCLPVYDPNGTTSFTVAVCGQPANGVVSVPATVNGNSVCLNYTPPTNFTGNAGTACIIVTDPTGLTSVAYVPIVVTPLSVTTTVTLPPVVTIVPITTPINQTVVVCQLVSSPNGATSFTASICGQPTSGTVSVVSTGANSVCLKYTLPTGFTGNAGNVCVVITEPTGQTTVVTVPVTVTPDPGGPGPHPPVVVPAPIVTKQGQPGSVCLPVTDPDGTTAFTVSLCGQPTSGTISYPTTVNNGILCISYTPTSSFTGNAGNVCLIVTDPTGLTTTVLVPVTVIPTSVTTNTTNPPVITGQTLITTINQPGSVCLPVGDPDGTTSFTAAICGQPANGTATVPASFTGNQLCVNYTPPTSFTGYAGMICVVITDPTGLTSTAQVPVVVSPVCTTVTTPLLPPVVVITPIVTPKETPQTVCLPVSSPNGTTSFTASICNQPTSGTVTVVSTSANSVCINYTPPTNFTGNAGNVCVTVVDPAGLVTVVNVPIIVTPVCVCPVRPPHPPEVTSAPLVTNQNQPGRVCLYVRDPDGTTNFTVTVCGLPGSGTATVPATVNGNLLCIDYMPAYNFSGNAGTVCLIVTDPTGLTATALVPVTVIPTIIPHPPVIGPGSITTPINTTAQICLPLSDPDGTTSYTIAICGQPTSGTVSAPTTVVGNQVCITYTPPTNFTGNAGNFCIKVTDPTGLTTTQTVSVSVVAPPPACVTINLKVFLEGPYNSSTHLMNTTLNQRGLLPGQTPIGNFAVATPAGQPYNTAPWNYTGTESVTSYASDIVDWVLVTLRTDSLTTQSTFRAAGLLHNDGRITFVNPCFTIPSGGYFAVIEHRNHMGVMTPRRVSVTNNVLNFDFTQQDSYSITNPPSFGEIQIDGRWMMYGADGKKDIFTDNFDINFFDSKLWKDESGIFDQYRYGDFNMDADVNFSDSVLWNKNNGRYSKVPH